MKIIAKMTFSVTFIHQFYVHFLEISYLWSLYQCSADFLLYVFKTYLKSQNCLDVWKLLLHHCWGLHPCFCSTFDLNWETMHTTVWYIINSLLPCKCCILSILTEIPARAICYRPSFMWYIIQMPFLYKHIECLIGASSYDSTQNIDKQTLTWTKSCQCEPDSCRSEGNS